MKEETIAFCMIVKNEERTIEKCLESIYDVVDEIVIADTGSTDNTLGIAKSFRKTKIVSIPWTNDFSAARNNALKEVSSDWVLMFDADELMAKKDALQIRALAQSGQSDAYLFKMRHYTTDSRRPDFMFTNQNEYDEGKGTLGYIPTDKICLFKNKKEIVFSGLIHETLNASLKKHHFKIASTDLVVHHYGYLLREQDKQKGQDRENVYIDLEKKQIQLTPKDPKPYFDLALLYMEKGLYEDALSYLEEAVELKPDYKEAVFNLAFVNFSLGEYADTKEILEGLIDKGGKSSMVLVQLGRACMKLHAYEEAIAALSEAANMDKNNLLANYHLGIIAQARGDFSLALEKFKKVLSINSEFTIVYLAIGVVYFLAKDFKNAKKNFLNVKENIPEYVEARYNLGLVYQEEKDFRSAVKEYLYVLDKNSKHLNATYNLGFAYQQLGDFVKALKYYKKTIALEPKASAEVNKRISEMENKK